MPYGYGRGRGSRGGMGLGFRGISSPWPYAGLGRGGLPRCSYYFRGAAAPAYQPRAYGFRPFAPPVTSEQELEFLKGQSEALRDELKEMETEIGKLSAYK